MVDRLVWQQLPAEMSLHDDPVLQGFPPGQRVEDKVQWAVELLQRYAPDLLA